MAIKSDVHATVTNSHSVGFISQVSSV